jgi:hypothetical protein
MNEQNLTQLRELLVKEFTEDELVALCQDVGINYAELPGMGAYGKTREIIAMAQARNVIDTLAARVNDLRPDAYKAARLPPMAPQTPMGAALNDPTRLPPEGVPAEVNDPVDREPYRPNNGVVSALSPRTRMIAIIVAVVLLAVAALTIILPKPGANTPPTPTPDMTATALALLPPTVQAVDVMTPTEGATSAEVAATSELSPSVDANATAAPAANQSHPAAQAITSINNQLIEFYTGKVPATDIKPYWGSSPYKVVTDFAYKTLKSKLGVDLAKGDEVSVTLRYEKQPELISENGDTSQVSTREYWGYTNPKTGRSICDTRDYTYTLLKNGDKYQVMGLRSKLVSARCSE